MALFSSLSVAHEFNVDLTIFIKVILGKNAMCTSSGGKQSLKITK